MILLTSAIIMGYSIYHLAKFGLINPGFKAVNTERMWDMVGFSFYCFEGIGTILPIMHESQEPRKFPKLLKLALGFLCVFFSIFGTINYAWFGRMKEPIIINNIDSSNVYI